MKVTKLNNLELINSLFVQLETLGFHIKDQQYGDSYFVFEGEENSVCHFHIKEIPRFLFGIWNINRYDTLDYQKEHNIPLWSDTLHIDSRSELIFFTQYERDLDKFKPSRSGFVTGLFRSAWEEENKEKEIVSVEEWNLFELENILKFMKKHPIKSVEYVGNQDLYIWDQTQSSIKILHNFIHDWSYYYRSKLKTIIKNKYYIYVAKKNLKRLTQFNYIFRDQGHEIHPNLDIILRRKEKIDLDLYNKDCIILDKLYDKYFNKISIDFYQYEIDENSDTEILEKDKKIRDRFFWFCDKYKSSINEDIWKHEKLLLDNVEEVNDLEEVKIRVDKERNNK